MKHLLRSFLLVLLSCTTSSLFSVGYLQEFRTGPSDKKWRIDYWKDSRAAWNNVTAHNQVREVLYAFYGETSWHLNNAATPRTKKAAFHNAPVNEAVPLPTTESVNDITKTIQESLQDGKVFVDGSQNSIKQWLTSASSGPLAQVGHKFSDFSVGMAAGVVYRDNTGVHYQQFEPQTSIMLPAITTWNHGSNNRSEGGWWVNSQLEEPSRGLITFTANINHNSDLYFTLTTKWKHYWGPSYKHGLQHNTHYQFYWVWGGWHSGNAGTKSRIQYGNYTVYDRNRAEQSQAFKDLGTFDQPYPGNGDLWIAIDHNKFYCGTGTPQSMDDFDKSDVTISYQTEYPGMDYLRWFALGGNSSYDTTYSNVHSHFLAPNTKFETPPHMAYRFTHWRDAWKLPTANHGAITFKARGEDVVVALHDSKLESDDYSINKVNYALACDNNNICLVKNGIKLDIIKHRNLNFLGGTNFEKYYDYWLVCGNGRILFGHGTTIGENLVAEFQDPEPVNFEYFSFSCYDRPVDYIDIATEEYHHVDKVETANQYTWLNSSRFATDNRGSVVFEARNTGSGGNRSVKVGFSNAPNGKPIPTDLKANYEVVFGAQDNTAGEILHMNGLVKEQRKMGTDGTPLGSLDETTDWQTLWVSFADGGIAYGKGDTINSNTIDNWSGTGDTPVNIFGLTGGSDRIEFRNIRSGTAESSSSYTTQANQNLSYQKWLGTWQFENANRGALAFKAEHSDVLQVGLAPAGSTSARSAKYDIVIGDGIAYIRRDRVKVEGSEASLPGTIDTSIAEHPYWVSFVNGTIALGTGTLTNIDNAGSEILRWTDDTFDAAQTKIKRFSFASKAKVITFNAITPGMGSDLDRRLDTVVAASQERTGIEESWEADTKKQTVGAVHANQFWWHEDRRFTQDNKTSFSCRLTKKGSEPMTALIGFGSSADSTFGQPDYKIALDSTTGIIKLYRNGTHVANADSTEIEAVRSLADGRMHTVWVNYDNGSISAGIDAATGSNPLWQFTDSSPLPGMRFAAVGTTQSMIEYTDITLSPFYDPSVLVTTGNRSYDWKPEWTFEKNDRGTASFSLKADHRHLIFSIGLGNTATVNENPDDDYNGALYNLECEYNGKIFIRQKAGLGTKIKDNDIRYGAGDPRHVAITSLSSSSTPVPCKLVYDKGRITFVVKDLEVYSRQIEGITEPINRYSFTSSGSTRAHLSKITTRAVDSSTIVAYVLEDIDAVLLSKPEEAMHRLEGLLAGRPYDARNATSIRTIMTKVVENKELFSKDQRISIANIIDDVLYEPIVNESAQSSLKAALTKLHKQLVDDRGKALPIDLASLTATYGANVDAVMAMDPEEPARRLFLKKLAALVAWPEEFSLEVANSINTNILRSDDGQTPLLEHDSLDTEESMALEEATTIGLLHLRTSAEKLKDPSFILQVINDIPNLSVRVLKLHELLQARRANTENKADGVLFTVKQKGLILDRIDAIIADREFLQDKTPLLDLLKTIRVTPGFARGTDTTDLTDYLTRIEAMQTLAESDVDFATRFEKLKVLLPKIESKPFSDPERMKFFIGLATLLTAPGIKGEAEMTDLTTIILDELEKRPMSKGAGSESELVSFMRTQTKNLSETTDLFAQSTTPAHILLHVDSLSTGQQLNHLQRLLNMQKDDSAPEKLTSEQHNVVFNKIGFVWENRDDLSQTELVALETLLGTVAETPGLAEKADTLAYQPQYEKTLPLAQRSVLSIINMIEQIFTPVPFGRQIAKLAAQASQIRLLKRGDTGRAAYIDKLVKSLQLPGNKTSDMLDKLKATIASLRVMNSTDEEKAKLAALEQAIVSLTDVKDLFALYDDFNLVIDNIESLEDRHSRLVHIEKLLKQQIKDRDEDIVKTRRQDLFDMIGRVVDERYELVSTGKLEAVLLTGNSTPGFAGSSTNPLYYQSMHHGNQDTTGLLEVIETPLPFDVHLKHLLSIVEDIRTLPATDYTRRQFFPKLERLFEASGSKKSDDIAKLIAMTELLLEQTQLEANERQVVVNANTQATALEETTDYSSRTSDPIELMSFLKKEDNYEVRVDEIQKIINRQIDEQDVDIVSAIKSSLTSMLSTIVDEHDKMTATGVAKLRSLLMILRRTPFLNIDTLYFNGRSLDDLEKALNAGISFDRRLANLTDPVTGFKSIATLKESDPKRQEYMRQLRELLDAPGPKSEAALKTLVDTIVQPLLDSNPGVSEQLILENIITQVEEFGTYNDPLSISDDPGFLVSILNKIGSMEQRLITIKWILDAQVNEADANILMLDGKDQRPTLIEALRSMVERRYLITDDQIKRRNDGLIALLRQINVTPFLDGYRTQTVAFMDTLQSDEVAFGVRLGHLKTYVADASKEEDGGPFFTILSKLMGAPGEKSVSSLEEIEEILTSLRQNPLSDKQENIVEKVEADLKLARDRNDSFKSHLAIAHATQDSLISLATELQKMLYAKSTTVMFANDDFRLFVDQLRYIVKNRELLIDAEGKTSQTHVDAILQLIKTTRLNGDFNPFVTELEELYSELKTQTAHEFESRIEQAQLEVGRFFDATTNSPYKIDALNHFWNRFMRKLNLMLGEPEGGDGIDTDATLLVAPEDDAPGLKTERQFMILESGILQRLAASKQLNDADLKKVTILINRVIEKKAEILEDQKTFEYHFRIALKQKDNNSAFIEELLKIMEGNQPDKGDARITFEAGDFTTDDLTEALEELAAERDALDDNDIKTLGTVITYAMYSQDFKEDASLVARLQEAAMLLNTPKPFSDRVTEYLDEFEEKQIMYKSHADRFAFFTKLEKLKETGEEERDEDALRLLKKDDLDPDAPDGLLDILKRIKTDSRESRIIGELEKLITKAASENRTAEYQLNKINREHADLYPFARAIIKVMRGRGSVYQFGPGDATKMGAALAHVVLNRRLLSSTEAPEQLKTVQNDLRRIIRSGKFDEIKEKLQALEVKLGTVQDFATCIKDASEELARFTERPKDSRGRPIKEDDWQRVLRERFAGNRIKRLVKLVTTITSAPGSKEDPNDDMKYFDQLDNLLDEMAMLPLQKKEAAQINAMIDSLTLDKKNQLITEGRRFTHHFADARLHKDENLSLYTSSLHNMMKDHRLGRVTMTADDFGTFKAALTVLYEDIDAMSLGDRQLFGEAANFARYSPSCPDILKVEFKALEAQIKQPITFDTALVDKYAALVETMLGLTPGQRDRHFKKLINLQSFTEHKPINVLLDFKERVIEPLRQLPKSGDEEKLFTTIENNHTADVQVASMASSALAALLSKITQAQTDTARNHIDLFISGIDNITLNGLIKFNATDYKKIVDECEKWIVKKRELLSVTQVENAQEMLTFGASEDLALNPQGPFGFFHSGFEKLSDRIKKLYTDVATPYTFEERIKNYLEELPRIRLADKTSPVKEEFAIKISTLFDAPGARSKQLLSRLKALTAAVLNGSFTDAQKEFYVRPVANLIDDEYKELNSFAYHYKNALNEATPEAFHNEIQRLLNVHRNTPEEMTITANDYKDLVALFEDQFKWRPIVGVESSLKLAMEATQQLLEQSNMPGGTPIPGSITMITTLSNMVRDIGLAVTPQTRINQLTSNGKITNMLNEPLTSGERKRFFSRMSRFSANLNNMSDAQKADTTLNAALITTADTIDNYADSRLATGGEKAVMRALRDRLRAAKVEIEKAQAVAEQALIINQEQIANAPIGSNQVSSGMMATPAVRRGASSAPAVGFNWRRKPQAVSQPAPRRRAV